MNTSTFYAVLAAMPDHRTKKGRRLPLAAIVTIALTSMLSGANDLMAIARWGRHQSPKALQALGGDKKRRQAPSTLPISMFFRHIYSIGLKAALGTLVDTNAGLGHVTIDDKRLRGTQHETSRRAPRASHDACIC
jgi:hypothetical protein